jgi:hypothetical protein
VKLVHNIVLSMPSPTPPDKVLAAAKTFAREKFAVNHRYAMALHTHQQHPHVHLVVKAEGVDGGRLHIDKALLREWRQDWRGKETRRRGGAFRVHQRKRRAGDRNRRRRKGPERRPDSDRDRFTSAQVEQIRRTVRRTPEVMVKVTVPHAA